MRAAVLTDFGSDLQIMELPDPSPKAGEVLIRIGASAVNPLDTKIRRGEAAHAATVLPAVLGMDATGTVAELGRDVTGFEVGEGFDVILDTVGGATLDDSFVAVKRYTGHVVSALGWGSHSLAPLSFRGASYSGVFALAPLLTGKGRERHGEILGHAAELVVAGNLMPRIDPRTFTLDSIGNAYDAVKAGTSVGKVIVNLASEGTA